MDRRAIDVQAEQTIISNHFPEGYGGPWAKVELSSLKGSEVHRCYRCYATDGRCYLAKVFEKGSIWETALRRPTGIELLKSLKLRPQDRLEIPLLWPPVKLDEKCFFTFVEDFGADNAFHACFTNNEWSVDQFELWLETIASAVAHFNFGNRDLVTIGMGKYEITHVCHGDFNFRNIITVNNSVAFIDTANSHWTKIADKNIDLSNMVYILWVNYVAPGLKDRKDPNSTRGMMKLPFESYAGLVNTFILKYFETARSLLPVAPQDSEFCLKDWAQQWIWVAMNKLKIRIDTRENLPHDPNPQRAAEFQNYFASLQTERVLGKRDDGSKKIDISPAEKKIV